MHIDELPALPCGRTLMFLNPISQRWPEDCLGIGCDLMSRLTNQPLSPPQYEAGHKGFTCATPREVLGLAQAGLGDDLLLANETVDVNRLTGLQAVRG